MVRLLVAASAFALLAQQSAPPQRPVPAAKPKPTAPAPQTEMQKAVEEFKAQTRNLGLRADSPVRARSNGAAKPKWHGRLFENLRNDVLDSIPHEVAQRGGTKGMLRRNQFGFNVTGPVIVPKLYNGGRNTFFSFTYEAMRERIGRSFLRTIPTMPERSGNWSDTVDLAGQPLPIYDPRTTAANPRYDATQAVSTDNLQYDRAPFPANRIPASRLDSAAQKAISYYPAPNSDAGPFFRNNYFVFAPEVNKADGVIAGVDHTVNEKHRVRTNINYSNGTDGAAPWFPSIANPGSVPRDRASRRGTLEHVLTASSKTVNTATLDVSMDRSVNKPLLEGDGRAFPRYQFQPYLSMGTSYPISRNARATWVLTNGYSTRHKDHRLRVVGQFIREQVNTFWPQYPSGSYRFSAGLTSLPGIVNTGHAFASFLLGGPEYAEISLNGAPSYFRRSRYYVGLRDQWELRKGLTLSLAFNFDGSTPRVEKYDRQSTVSLTEVNPVNGRAGAMIIAGRGRARAFQPFNLKGEPSASIAWNAFGSTRNVVRAGYSRSYSPIPIYLGQWGTQAFNGSPTWVSPNPQLAPAFTLANGLPPSAQTFPDFRPESANNTQADLIEASGRQPTYQSASLSLEKQLPAAATLTIGAGHSEGRNLLLSNSGSNPNAIPLSTLEYRDRLNDEQFNRSVRPYPQYQKFDVYSSWPEGKYKRDAAYVRLEKRTSGGLSMSAYYEFSKQMDNYSGPYGIQDYYNRRNEWSLTSSNNPHRVTLTYMYELPFGANKALFAVTDWRRYLVEGWSISGASTVLSGEPLALRPQFNNTGGVVDVLNVRTVPGVDPHVPNAGPDLWYNPAAFVQPADFTIGDASRTHPSLRMPMNQNHDLSVTKRIPVTPENSLEFSMVGLNFVNHADWTDPDTIIGPASAPNVNAGRIIGSRGGRVIQVGLRLNF
ncbi:MAG: hypothetical protein U0Q16_16425 [Bryobacteraceae bacterium]